MIVDRVRTRFSVGLLTAMAIAFCASCGGTANNGALPATGAQTASSTLHRRAAVSFRFKIPRHRRHAHYLSTATASLQVTAFDATHTHQLAQAAINTVPGKGSCTAVSSGTFTCSLAMTIPPGNDTFDVAAYDGANETGKELSAAADLAVKIVAGKANNVALTLGGIPASLAVTLVGGSPFVVGSVASGLQLGGIGKGAVQQLQLTTKDADGYTIVNPGAPAMSVTSSAPSKLSATAVSGSLGLFNVMPLQETNASPSPNPSTAITLTASATAAGFTPISSTISVQNDPIAYVGITNNAAEILAYAPWQSTPVLTIPLPSPTPAQTVSTAVDSSGNLYAASESSGAIAVYPPGSATASRTITGVFVPYYIDDIAVDSLGDIYAVEELSGLVVDVDEFTPAGGNTPATFVTSTFSLDPTGVAVDAANNFYVPFLGGSTLSIYASGSSTPSATITSGISAPVQPAFDSQGNLYVANRGGVNVTEYKPPFSSASTPAATFGTSATMFEPTNLAIDGLGNVYVADEGNSNILEYSPGAPTTVVRTFAATATAYDVAVDQLGYVYVPWIGKGGPVNVFPPGTSTTAIENWTTGANYPWSITVWP